MAASRAITLALALTACGDDASQAEHADSGGGATLDGGGGGGTAGSAGGLGGAPSGGEGGAPSASDAGGSATAPRTIQRHAIIATSNASSHSLRIITQTPEQACVQQSLGFGCETEICPTATAPDVPDLGSVVVSASLGELRAEPGPDGQYTSPNGSGPLWAEGDAVHFLAAGNDLPAVDETLVGPGDFSFTSGDSLTVSPGSPLSVSWTGTDVATMLVALVFDQDGESTQIRCFAPASARSVTIDGAVTERLPPSGAVSVVMMTESRRVIAVTSEQEIRLFARSEPVTIQTVVQ